MAEIKLCGVNWCLWISVISVEQPYAPNRSNKE